MLKKGWHVRVAGVTSILSRPFYDDGWEHRSICAEHTRRLRDLLKVRALELIDATLAKLAERAEEIERRKRNGTPN